MKTYIKPEISVMEFTNEDIIQLSSIAEYDLNGNEIDYDELGF